MNKKNKLNLFIIAGEDSGDFHGAHIIQEIKKKEKRIVLTGLGGKYLKKAGLNSFYPLKNLSVMGFWEVLKNLSFFFKLEKELLHHIKQNRPDKIILIDYPGFNMRLAKKIKQITNIPIYYYISPQLWAWKEKRLQTIKNYIDYMIVIFPFEKIWYQKRGIKVQYFGHPILDLIKNQDLKKTNLGHKVRIALCPGSRMQEINKHLPVFERLIQYYGIENKNIEFIIYKAPGIQKQTFSQIDLHNNVTITSNTILKSFKSIDLAVVASGTATLECAMSLTPFITIYKMSYFSWIITKKLVKSPFASMVNILAKKLIVTELLQANYNIKNLIKNIDLLLDPLVQNHMVRAFKNIRSQLGSGLAYEQTAEFILNEKNN
tara:strand:+ start:701 stop:1825 length:1125 start_codon:yes stop_codon:yes gene_type:complete